jgi:hypothetical protein
MWFRSCVLLGCVLSVLVAGVKISAVPKTWTNQWALAINGTQEHAHKLCDKHGFVLAGEVCIVWLVWRQECPALRVGVKKSLW